jgi:hypothetical protein
MWNQGFSSYFSWMMEGFRARSVPRTIGSGSGWPKNIPTRIRIWIRNTVRNDHGSGFTVEGVLDLKLLGWI